MVDVGALSSMIDQVSRLTDSITRSTSVSTALRTPATCQLCTYPGNALQSYLKHATLSCFLGFSVAFQFSSVHLLVCPCGVRQVASPCKVESLPCGFTMLKNGNELSMKAVGWPWVQAYAIPSFQFDIKLYRSNRPPHSAVRAPGKFQAPLIMEHIIEHVAARLDMDPVTVRETNFIKAPAPGTYCDLGSLALKKGIRV